MTAAVPALLAALAVLAARLPAPAEVRVRTLAAGSRAAATPWLPVAAGVLVAVTLGPVAALLAAALALVARGYARRAAARRTTAAHAAALPEVCRAVAAELRSGVPPGDALARAAGEAPPALAAHLRELATACRLGPAPPAARWTALPGADGLAAVAALWSTASGAGSGLADGLDRLAEALAADQRQRAEVATQLAGPKASAAVLAALPACGVALAAALGAHPLVFLLGTPAGLVCLAAGLVLDAVGVWWVRRLTARASP